MADALEQLRKELEHRKDECFSLKEAHNRAAEFFERRNNRLTLTALVFSALTGTSAIWSAIEASFSAPLPLALWGTAVTGLITTIVTGAQKTSWGGAEEAKNHQKAAAQFEAIARDARRDLAETFAQEERLPATLADVDERINNIRSSEPFLPEKFLSKADPASIQLDRLHEAGLVDVFETRASGSGAALLGERFQSKPKKVQILETWTGYESQLDTWITQAVKDGADVEILLLDPTSEHVKHRAQALLTTGVTAHDIKNHIEEDLRILGQVRGKFDQNSDYEGTLEVRVYDVTPVVNMYRFDEIRIVGMYLWGEDSITGPQFEVKASEGAQRTPLAEDFDEHFKKIWNHTGKNPTKQVAVENGKLVTKPLREEDESMITEA